MLNLKYFCMKKKSTKLRKRIWRIFGFPLDVGKFVKSLLWKEKYYVLLVCIYVFQFLFSFFFLTLYFWYILYLGFIYIIYNIYRFSLSKKIGKINFHSQHSPFLFEVIPFKVSSFLV